MGKQGPCHHCGVTSTPLWRNGPPDKPVLCNACGSRWRTKGSLTNYTPHHARDPLELDEIKVPKEKHITFKLKDQKLHKRKLGGLNVEVECGSIECGQNFHRGFDEDMSNRSSSESAVSYSESCAHFGDGDVNDITGSSQTNVWESLVTFRKRTNGNRPKPSHVEKLTKDLHSILHQQSSYFSGSSEEDLLYESETHMGSIEIGNGSVLIRCPNLTALEEESEASSLPVENNLIYSDNPHHSHIQNKEASVTDTGHEKLKRFHPADHLKSFSQENFQILHNRDSHLGSVDLNDVVSYEEFTHFLSHEEQQQLMRYLPSIDTTIPVESLKSTFKSSHFQEALSSFQLMLWQGVFDLTFSAASADECESLKRLVLSNLSKATWVEQYKTLKDSHHQPSSWGRKAVKGANLLSCSKSVSMKRPRDSQNQNSSELKTTKGLKKVCKSGMLSNLPNIKSPKWSSSDVNVKTINVTNGYTESGGSCFSPRSLFACGSNEISLLNSMQFTDVNEDQDLLLDVRSNTYFPEAELLSDLCKQNLVPRNIVASVSEVSENKESLSCEPPSSFSHSQLNSGNY